MQRSQQQPSTRPAALHDDDAELAAYNLAFSELGLEWHWDRATYQQIRSVAGERPCVQAYVESECPHLLHAYDSGFLVDAIESVRGRGRQTAGV